MNPALMAALDAMQSESLASLALLWPAKLSGRSASVIDCDSRPAKRNQQPLMGYSWVPGAPKFSKDGPTAARWNKRAICSRHRLLREKGRWSKTTWVVTDHATSP